MKKSHEARQKLLRLGIFRKVEVVIDTAQGKKWVRINRNISVKEV